MLEVYANFIPIKVKAFIVSNPDLVSIINEGCWRIYNRFGVETLLIPEISGNTLRIYITTTLNSGEALDKLHNFDNWWFKQPYEVHDKLEFTLRVV